MSVSFQVKNQSLTIDYILPESIREQEKCASSLPQYAWVNTARSRSGFESLLLRVSDIDGQVEVSFSLLLVKPSFNFRLRCYQATGSISIRGQCLEFFLHPKFCCAQKTLF